LEMKKEKSTQKVNRFSQRKRTSLRNEGVAKTNPKDKQERGRPKCGSKKVQLLRGGVEGRGQAATVPVLNKQPRPGSPP